jgi:hypothetical protein
MPRSWAGRSVFLLAARALFDNDGGLRIKVIDMDGRLHQYVLTSFVRRGHAPSLDELGQALQLPRADVEAGLRRLHNAHGLMLHPHVCEVWIAHPFSTAPTGVWVGAEERGWWAPCLWCAAGVVALAAPDATIHARLGGESQEARIEIRGGACVSDDFFVHFAMPPREAWSNVVHWCSTVLPFTDAAQVDAWSERHRLPRGVLVRWTDVLALGRVWYGRHLEEDWKKWSTAEAQQIFDQHGLRGDFWHVPASDEPF